MFASPAHSIRAHSIRARILAALAIASALTLGGCAAETPDIETPVVDTDTSDAMTETGDPTDDDNDGEDNAAPPAGTAALVMAGQSFTFEPTVCSISDEDLLVSGPGADDDSEEPAFLDVDVVTEGSFSHGEVRIELGTDQPFDSRDEFMVALIGGVDDFLIAYDGDAVTIEGEFRFAGEEPLGPGTLSVDCG